MGAVDKKSASVRPAPGTWAGRLRQPWVLALILACATLAVYSPIGRNDFVNYDDLGYITENPKVQQGLTPESMKWALTTGHASNWHPLTWWSHMLDWELFGSNAAGHHWVSVGLHVINAVLLFLLLRQITGSHWRSAAVAAFFALHPIRVESVAWVSERKDVLSTFFWLLCVGAYCAWAGGRGQGSSGKTGKTGRSGPRSAEAGNLPPRGAFFWPVGSPLAYVAALGFFALGLMSKPMLVTVPFFLLLLDVWPLERIGLTELVRQPGVTGRLLLEKVPFVLLTFLSSVLTLIVQEKGGAVSASLTLGERAANAAVSYIRYLGKLIWPSDLSVLYLHPRKWPVWVVVACATLLVLLTVGAIWFGRRRSYLFTGWFWFVGLLVPVIGLVQVGIQSMADRYAYVPAIGVLVVVVWAVSDLALVRRWAPGPLAFASVVGLGLCGLLTVKQVGYWRTSGTLFGHAVKVDPENYLAWNNLGYYLLKKGNPDEAMRCYEKALRINPNYDDALNNMGLAMARQGGHREAITYYERALRIRPRHAEVHNNLGNSLSEVGRIDEAIAHYRFVLQQKPDHADAHNNLGIALAMKGQLDEAIGHFREAFRFRSDYASAHSNLGNAFAAQRKLDEAIGEYRECLRLNPEDPQAHNNLANVLAEQGKHAEAEDHYRTAIRLNPANPETFFNYGVVLVRAGKRDEALKAFQEALRLNPNYAQARQQLQALLGSGQAP